MLSYALAIAVAISSLVLFSTAFFMSNLHRKDDFLWSAVGLFYALVLWYCAKNITGAVLLGQAAATVLLVSYSWQVLRLRKTIDRGAATVTQVPQQPANAEKVAKNQNFSLLQAIKGFVRRDKSVAPPADSGSTPKASADQVSTIPATMPKVTEQAIAIPDSPQTIAEETPPQTAVATPEDEPTSDPVSNPKTPKIESAEPESEVAATQPTAEVSKVEEAIPATKEEIATVETKITETTAPLPTKLPEVANKVSNQQSTKETQASPPNQPPNVSENNDFKVETDTPSTATPPEERLEESDPPTDTSSIKASPLDTLETVEVAEVLEALPEEADANRESDRANIIEVTTTEIEITRKTKQIVQNPEDESSSE